MNIPLQIWLSKQKISKASLSSFDESFNCFKIGAYKAALLFAYLGFMSVVRDRLLSAQLPKSIDSKRWANTQAQARDPAVWEKTIFDAIQQKNPAVFILSDDLRDQMKYWKDRRNDCAHSRQNKIIAAHVEAFYAFVESNLSKFVVNGSRNEMARRILDYFNPSLTPPSEPIEPIILDLVNAINVAEYQEFISEISAKLDNSSSSINKMLGITPNTVSLLEACFRYGTDELQEACKAHLITDDSLLISFLRQHPQRVYILQDQPQKVRLIWHKCLNDSKDLAVLCSFLRASLIPQEQIPEAIKCAIHCSNGLPDDLDLRALVAHGFYETLKKAIVDDSLLSNFSWANSNKELVIKYLSDNRISCDVALAIYKAFNSEYYAWELANYLDLFFLQNPDKRKEYYDCIGENIGRPQAIKSLTNPRKENVG